MMQGNPVSVTTVDERFRAELKLAHRRRWALIGAIITLLVAAVIVLSFIIMRQQTELRSSCEFWRTLASASVAVPPPAKPSRLGVVVIAAARDAGAGEGCGALPPPSPSLLQWAAYYGIHVSRLALTRRVLR